MNDKTNLHSRKQKHTQFFHQPTSSYTLLHLKLYPTWHSLLFLPTCSYPSSRAVPTRSPTARLPHLGLGVGVHGFEELGTTLARATKNEERTSDVWFGWEGEETRTSCEKCRKWMGNPWTITPDCSCPLGIGNKTQFWVSKASRSYVIAYGDFHHQPWIHFAMSKSP